MPSGWLAVTDPNSGRTYYANQVTGETSWDAPCPPSSQTHPVLVPSMIAGTVPTEHSTAYGSTSLKETENNQCAPLRSAIATTTPFTAANMNVSHSSCVAAARSMVKNDASPNPGLELHSLSVGRIADLYYLQQQQQEASNEDDSTNEAYLPLQPFSLDSQSIRPAQEQGRIEVRLRALYDQLQRIGEKECE